MADDSPKGSRKFGLLVGAMVVITALLATVNVYLLVDNRAEAEENDTDQASSPQRAEKPRFVAIDSFTVNLQDDRCGRRLLYVGLSFQVGNEETHDFLTEHMPQLRSRLLMMLSDQHGSEITAAGGKGDLKEKILALFDEPLSKPQPELLVDDVLFTEFIVQ